MVIPTSSANPRFGTPTFVSLTSQVGNGWLVHRRGSSPSSSASTRPGARDTGVMRCISVSESRWSTTYLLLPSCQSQYSRWQYPQHVEDYPQIISVPIWCHRGYGIPYYLPCISSALHTTTSNMPISFVRMVHALLCSMHYCRTTTHCWLLNGIVARPDSQTSCFGCWNSKSTGGGLLINVIDGMHVGSISLQSVSIYQRGRPPHTEHVIFPHRASIPPPHLA